MEDALAIDKATAQVIRIMASANTVEADQALRSMIDQAPASARDIYEQTAAVQMLRRLTHEGEPTRQRRQIAAHYTTLLVANGSPEAETVEHALSYIGDEWTADRKRAVAQRVSNNALEMVAIKQGCEDCATPPAETSGPIQMQNASLDARAEAAQRLAAAY